MSMRRDRTVILGAGLCGLSAAYHLEEKAETDHLVLEQAHESANRFPWQLAGRSGESVSQLLPAW